MMETEDHIRQLRDEQRFFHLFNEAELQVLRPLFRLVRCCAGETLFEEGGETEPPFSVIVSGTLEAKKKTDFGRPLVLAVVTRGTLVGHASLYRRTRRMPITIAALQDAEILSVPSEAFNLLLEEHPAIGVKILKEVVRIQDVRLQELLERFTATL